LLKKSEKQNFNKRQFKFVITNSNELPCSPTPPVTIANYNAKIKGLSGLVTTFLLIFVEGAQLKRIALQMIVSYMEFFFSIHLLHLSLIQILQGGS